MKKYIFTFFLLVIVLAGCASNVTKQEEANWQVSPTFTKDDQVLYGTEGKFGMININCGSDPVFPAEEGRLYRAYFLENVEGYSKYQITATHKQSGRTEKLLDMDIAEVSEFKFGVNEAGRWKMDVTIDGEPYTDFVLEPH